MKRINFQQVLALHKKMINATGGADGLRDIGLLESALNNAFATFDGIELYPSVEEKCANICYCLVENHPFSDGNKRIGIYVMLVLLEYNDIKLKYTQQDLIDLGLGIAEGKYNQVIINKWINAHKMKISNNKIFDEPV